MLKGLYTMTSFEKMFRESKGKPITYMGKTLVMNDRFPTHGAASLNLTIETSSPGWRQGVALDTVGSFSVNGRPVSGKIVIWQDTGPPIVEIELIGNCASVEIKNVWDIGDGVMQAWHNGAAMIVEELAHGRRYRCNDGYPDDDFDDIVFRIERLTLP